MNLRNLLSLACLSALCACSNAGASTLDAGEDLDCSVVLFYFKGLAEHLGRPANERHATMVIHEWYGARIRKAAPERWSDEEAMLAEAAPILETIKAEPMAARDELMTCTERAVDDPSFDAFARSMPPTA
jgi:hypothetical protein